MSTKDEEPHAQLVHQELRKEAPGLLTYHTTLRASWPEPQIGGAGHCVRRNVELLLGPSTNKPHWADDGCSRLGMESPSGTLALKDLCIWDGAKQLEPGHKAQHGARHKNWLETSGTGDSHLYRNLFIERNCRF